VGYIADHAAEGGKLQWMLIEIDFSTPMRLTDCPVAVEYGGHTWLPHGVQNIAIQNPSTGPTMSFTVADADNYVFPWLNDTNGAEGLVVNAWLAEFAPTNATATPDDVVLVFTGRAKSATSNASGIDQAEFQCGPPALTTSINFPSRAFGSLARSLS
jgi:hypothetical protein